MASLGHIAVGAAAARIEQTTPLGRPSFATVAFWSALSFLPDADVVGFSLGVPYGAEWGHRGATHSFVFALAIGVAIGLGARLTRRPALRTGLMATLVVASHPLLDILTDGGLGCALFWPFDDTRYFAPWRPIPVAPIGLAFFSSFGLMVALREVVILAPLWWYAFRGTGATSARAKAFRVAGWGLWVVMMWLLTSVDQVRERVVAAVLGDTTQYTAGFSEQGFASIAAGQSEADVLSRIGEPFQAFMLFSGDADACSNVGLNAGVVDYAHPPDACERRGIRVGLSRDAVVDVLGQPERACWDYSHSRGGGYFRARSVCFFGGEVYEVRRRWVRG